MSRSLRGVLLYGIVLVIFGALVLQLVNAGNPNVRELNSQEFQQAVDDQAFVLDDEKNPLLVKDADQTITGALQGSDEEPEKFKFPYTEHYDVAATLNAAEIPFRSEERR